jgi:hypothetical protein
MLKRRNAATLLPQGTDSSNTRRRRQPFGPSQVGTAKKCRSLCLQEGGTVERGTGTQRRLRFLDPAIFIFTGAFSHAVIRPNLQGRVGQNPFAPFFRSLNSRTVATISKITEGAYRTTLVTLSFLHKFRTFICVKRH